jgi:hypothetical protein
MQKFEENLSRVFQGAQRDAILRACLDRGVLEQLPVNEFVDLFVTES